MAQLLSLLLTTLLLHSANALADFQPWVSLSDPDRLEILEKKNLSLGDLLGGATFARADNAKLWSMPTYRAIAESISTELDDLSRKDLKLSVTMSTSRRLFDRRWLKSPSARFELVGVFNRMDRAVFQPDRCGEIRLIYRLSYSIKKGTSTIASRLPLTLNVVFWAKPLESSLSCNQIAQAWAKNVSLEDVSLLKSLKSIETNLQVIRWPATVRPELGGHAEYMLRVFRRDPLSGVMKLSVLENTPDLEALAASRALKAELLSWIKSPENLRAIDRGTASIPDRSLAKKAQSFAFHGSSRLANRPFDQVFSAKDFKNVSLKSNRFARTPEALIKRLNDMSCIGCHQGRTIAGFHFVGVDRKGTDPLNSIGYAASAHLQNDLLRRQAFVRKLLASEEADPSRPFSERSETESGDFGAACSLGNDPSFAAWKCQAPLKCQGFNLPESSESADRQIGRCYPENSETRRVLAGSPCQPGRLTQTKNFERDNLKGIRELECGPDSVCEDMSVGFPNGMCSGGCEVLQPGETCGAIAILASFNACLSHGKPFRDCLAKHVRPAAMKACSPEMPCRDDYICAKTTQGAGACIPPYFLFQLRLDGHPKPPAT